jgi:hypothetical protein
MSGVHKALLSDKFSATLQICRRTQRYAATPRQQGTPQSEMLENVQRQEMTNND